MGTTICFLKMKYTEKNINYTYPEKKFNGLRANLHDVMMMMVIYDIALYVNNNKTLEINE